MPVWNPMARFIPEATFPPITITLACATLPIKLLILFICDTEASTHLLCRQQMVML